jgi:hypothetical protein
MYFFAVVNYSCIINIHLYLYIIGTKIHFVNLYFHFEMKKILYISIIPILIVPPLSQYLEQF